MGKVTQRWKMSVGVKNKMPCFLDCSITEAATMTSVAWRGRCFIPCRHETRSTLLPSHLRSSPLPMHPRTACWVSFLGNTAITSLFVAFSRQPLLQDIPRDIAEADWEEWLDDARRRSTGFHCISRRPTLKTTPTKWTVMQSDQETRTDIGQTEGLKQRVTSLRIDTGMEEGEGGEGEGEGKKNEPIKERAKERQNDTSKDMSLTRGGWNKHRSRRKPVGSRKATFPFAWGDRQVECCRPQRE